MILTRQRLLLGLGAAGLLPLGDADARWLERVNRRWIVSEDEAIRCHAIKDEKGPALTGDESWRPTAGAA